MTTIAHPPPLPSPSSAPISHGVFREMAMATPGRSILFLRHAERPNIQKDDPTFGIALGLTPAGTEMAQRCGQTLAGIRACCFGASPMRRTYETARMIAEGMGVAHAEIFDAPNAGVNGLWVEDINLLHSFFVKEGSEAFTDRYLRNGHAEGYRSIADGTRDMCDWLMQTDFGAPCTIIVSHDIFIATLLQGLGVRQFSSRHWVGFLQGAAIVQDRDGHWQAFYCVPDTTHFENTFIQ